MLDREPAFSTAMILRWLICFSALAVSAPAASVHGRIALAPSSAGPAGAVVWLEPVSGPAPLPRPVRATMLQQSKTFTPHVLAVPVGATVDFPNRDPIFHNAFSNFSGQIFDIGLYRPGSSKSVAFNRPGVVRIFCNIHAAMSAVIVVLDTPWFALAPASGEFSIPAVPPGAYVLHLFHERATPQTLLQLARRVLVAADNRDLGELAIPVSAYLPLPHKNKYGREYAPPSGAYSPTAP